MNCLHLSPLTWLSPLMPALLIAMTNGDAAAVPLDRLRRGSLDGTSQTNDDHTSKVEKENTDIDTFNSFREVASRVLSFASGNLRAVY